MEPGRAARILGAMAAALAVAVVASIPAAVRAAPTLDAHEPIAARLVVAPTDGLSSSGLKGGPFSPSSKTYTLFNTAGEFALSWTAVTGQNWVTVSPPSGSIPSGEIRNVELSIHSSANSLPDGNYTDTLTFTNTTNGLGNTTRSINLTVFTPTPTHTPTPTPTPKPTPSPTPTPTHTPTPTPT